MRKLRHTEVVHKTKSPTLVGLHNSGEGRQALNRSRETAEISIREENTQAWDGVG